MDPFILPDVRTPEEKITECAHAHRVFWSWWELTRLVNTDADRIDLRRLAETINDLMLIYKRINVNDRLILSGTREELVQSINEHAHYSVIIDRWINEFKEFSGVTTQYILPEGFEETVEKEIAEIVMK